MIYLVQSEIVKCGNTAMEFHIYLLQALLGLIILSLAFRSMAMARELAGLSERVDRISMKPSAPAPAPAPVHDQMRDSSGRRIPDEYYEKMRVAQARKRKLRLIAGSQ